MSIVNSNWACRWSVSTLAKVLCQLGYHNCCIIIIHKQICIPTWPKCPVIDQLLINSAICLCLGPILCDYLGYGIAQIVTQLVGHGRVTHLPTIWWKCIFRCEIVAKLFWPMGKAYTHNSIDLSTIDCQSWGTAACRVWILLHPRFTCFSLCNIREYDSSMESHIPFQNN